MYELRVVSDIVIFKIIESQLCMLIVQRDKIPYIGKWCLPGGFVREDETVEQTAFRIVKGETGVSNIHLKQLHVFSGLKRDPRWRAIGVGFMGILTTDDSIKAGPEQQQVIFCPVKNLPKLVFDHQEIFVFAKNKLIDAVENGDIVQYFLPKYFTLQQLQQVYEVILQRRYDKRNFRRIIDKHHTLKPTKKKQKNVAHRPATLYIFQK